MCNPLIGALNGTTVCLFLEGDNLLEVADESPVRVGGGGAREYAGGLSPGSELGKDLSNRCQKLIIILQNEGGHTDLSRVSLGGG